MKSSLWEGLQRSAFHISFTLEIILCVLVALCEAKILSNGLEIMILDMKCLQSGSFLFEVYGSLLLRMAFDFPATIARVFKIKLPSDFYRVKIFGLVHPAHCRGIVSADTQLFK